MKAKISWITRLLSGVLAIIGLGSCASKKVPIDNVDKNLREIAPQEEIGRAVVLYGGPPVMYEEKLVAPESSVESEVQKSE